MRLREIIARALVAVVAYAVAIHGCWASIDCDMRIDYARKHGRTYDYDRCVEARAREGMWPAVWEVFL